MSLFGTSRFKNMGGVSAKTFQDAPAAPAKPANFKIPTPTLSTPIDPFVKKTVNQEIAHLSAPTNIAPVSAPKPNSPIFGGGLFGGGMAERARQEAERMAKIAAEKAKEAQQTQTIVTTRTVPGPFGQPVTIPVTQTIPAQKQVVTAAVAIRNEAIKEATEAEKALQEAREAANKAAKAAETIKKEIAQIDKRQETLTTILTAKPVIRTVPGIFGKSIQIPVPGTGASMPLAQRQALERELQELNEKEKLALEAKKQIEAKAIEVREDVKEAREEKVAADQALRAANIELNKTIVQQQLRNIPRIFAPPPNLIKPVSVATPDKSVSAAVKEEAVKAVLGDVKPPVSGLTSKPPTTPAPLSGLLRGITIARPTTPAPATPLAKLNEVVKENAVSKTPTFGGIFSGGSLRPTNMFESMMERLEEQAKDNAARAAALEKQNNALNNQEIYKERYEVAVERTSKADMALTQAIANRDRIKAELESTGKENTVVGIGGGLWITNVQRELRKANLEKQLDEAEAMINVTSTQQQQAAQLMNNAKIALEKSNAQVTQSAVKPVGSVKPLTNAFGFTIPSSILGRDKDDRKDDTKEVDKGDVDKKPPRPTGLFGGGIFRPPVTPVSTPEPQTTANALATLQRSGLFGRPILPGITSITEVRRTLPEPPKPLKGFGKF